MKHERLKLSILGKRADSIRLDELNLILQSYQCMLDRSYLALTGEDRIRSVRSAKRMEFYAHVPSLSKGSIIMDILVPLVSLGPQAVDAASSSPVSYMMGTILDLFKATARLRDQHRQQPSIQIASNGNAVGPITINGDKNIIIVPLFVKNGADLAKNPVSDMVRAIEKEGLDEIRSSNKNGGGTFSIKKEDVAMLKPVSVRSSIPETMIVNIFQFNKDSGKGALRVVESEEISNGVELKFSATAKLHKGIINAMHAPTKVTSTQSVLCYPNGEWAISRIYIKAIH